MNAKVEEKLLFDRKAGNPISFVFNNRQGTSNKDQAG